VRPETAGEERDRVRLLHEEELAREEVPEADQLLVVADRRVGRLLPRQADVDAEALLTAGAALRRAHDPVARAGDDHPAGARERLRETARLLVLGRARRRARAAEDRDLAHVLPRRKDPQCVADLLQRAVDQLQVAARRLLLQQLYRRDAHLAHQLGVGRRPELRLRLLDQGADRGVDGGVADLVAAGRLGGTWLSRAHREGGTE
jgi:hypothetical protein